MNGYASGGYIPGDTVQILLYQGEHFLTAAQVASVLQRAQRHIRAVSWRDQEPDEDGLIARPRRAC